ncbi:MAG TPA: hypothetical protein VF482_10100 [Trebonia sp.]
MVIGEPHRAFYGNQYGLTFPIFEHYGVPLWVPEVGGPMPRQSPLPARHYRLIRVA